MVEVFENELVIEVLKEVLSDCLEFSKKMEIKFHENEKNWKKNIDKFGFLAQLGRKILPLNVKKAIRFYSDLKKEENYYQVCFSEKKWAFDFLQYVLEKNPEIPFGLFLQEDWEEILKFVKNKFYCALLDKIPKEKLFDERNLKKQKEIENFLKQNPIRKIKNFYEWCGFKSVVSHFEPNIFLSKYGLEYLRKKDFRDLMVVDAGAFIGDTAFLFAKELNPKKIIAIEPDKINFEYLLKNIKLNSLQMIEPLQIGIGDKRSKGETSLEGGSSAYISEGNNGKLEIFSLDEFFANSEIPIGLIKMDIEGFELPAIKGAKNIIQKFKPTLIIALYHRGQDFFEIPKIIKEMVPEYKFRFTNINHFSPFFERIFIADCD